MYNRDMIYSGLNDAVQKQFYSSVPSGRPRIMSLLSGSLLGMSQVLPAENILNVAERFKFDLVEPSINRFSAYVANKHMSSTPTLRSMALSLVDMRLALAHNPLQLTSPIESLSWLAATHGSVTLFKDNALDIFRKLNISPFDIELRHLFKAFVEADGNLYQTTMNGIQAYCRRTYTRVNGTQIPLPSITEEELTIIASGYLGILGAYILPIPVTPVDNLQIYWTTSILPQVFALVDQFNERNVIDTKHIEEVIKTLYFIRYKTIHQPDLVAHSFVKVCLNTVTSPLPATLLENNAEDLIDQIADDVRDILTKAIEKERDPFSDVPLAYRPSFVDLGEIDNEVIQSIENDLDRLYDLQDHYAHTALNEADVLSLESLHARYYAYMKPVHKISTESMRNMSPLQRGTVSVSTEGASLVIVGLVAAAISAVVAILAKIFGFFGSAEKSKKDMETKITKTKEAIDSDLDSIKPNSMETAAEQLDEITSKGAKLIDDNFKKTRQVANIIMRYNPSVKIPQNIDNLDLFRKVGNLLKTRQTLEATMLTRKDNQQVAQIPAMMFDRKAMDLYKNQVTKLDNSLKDGIVLISQLLDPSFIDSRMRNETFVHTIEGSKFYKDTHAAGNQAESILELLKSTGPVNAPELMDLTYIDKLQMQTGASVSYKYAQKQITELKRSEKTAIKAIEELVTKGLVSDEYAKKSCTVLREAIKLTSNAAIAVAKCYKIHLNAIKTINMFISEFHYVTRYRKLFDSAELTKALERAIKIEDYDSDKHGNDKYIRVEI